MKNDIENVNKILFLLSFLYSCEKFSCTTLDDFQKLVSSFHYANIVQLFVFDFFTELCNNLTNGFILASANNVSRWVFYHNFYIMFNSLRHLTHTCWLIFSRIRNEKFWIISWQIFSFDSRVSAEFPRKKFFYNLCFYFFATKPIFFHNEIIKIIKNRKTNY